MISTLNVQVGLFVFYIFCTGSFINLLWYKHVTKSEKLPIAWGMQVDRATFLASTDLGINFLKTIVGFSVHKNSKRIFYFD